MSTLKKYLLPSFLHLGMATALLATLLFTFYLGAQAHPPDDPANVTTTPTTTKAARTATPAAPTSNTACLDAAKITLTHVGQTVCVSGTVSALSTDQAASYLKFKNARFQIISYNLKRDFSVLKNRCLKVTGAITKLGGRPALILADKIALTDCSGKTLTLPVKAGGSSPGTTTTPTRPAAPSTATPAPAGSPTSPAPASGTTGKIIVVNQTQHDVTFIVWGPSSQTFGAAGGQSNTVSIPVGDYGWTSVLNGCKLQPVHNLPVRSEYTLVITIVPADGCGGRLSLDVQ